MNIKLKNIKIGAEALCEETVNFFADIFVDNKKVGYAKNHGRGEATNCHPYEPYEKNKVVLQQAQLWALTLPSKVYGDEIMKMDLESWIDDQIEAGYNARAKKRNEKMLDKVSERWIVIYNEQATTYRTCGWKKTSVAERLKTASGIQALRNYLPTVISELKEGEEIYNKNLAAILKDIQTP